jgi:hypothetical protein
VDAFNIFAGVVGVVGVLFSVWTWLEGRRKESVEAEKRVTESRRLGDLLTIVEAIGEQGTIAAGLADRDSVTKKELKHILVAQQSTIQAARKALTRIHDTSAAWEYGLVDAYLPERRDSDDEGSATAVPGRR